MKFSNVSTELVMTLIYGREIAPAPNVSKFVLSRNVFQILFMTFCDAFISIDGVFLVFLRQFFQTKCYIQSCCVIFVLLS